MASATEIYGWISSSLLRLNMGELPSEPWIEQTLPSCPIGGRPVAAAEDAIIVLHWMIYPMLFV